MSPARELGNRLALKIWAALLILLAITCASAYVPMGPWNGAVNLIVATAKALLVAIFFMHLRANVVLLRLAAAIALFMLVLLFSLSGLDYLTRPMYPAPWQIPIQIPRLTPRS